jgi:hypothetical protein
VNWYVRAIARQAGLVHAVMNAPYLAACRLLLRTELMDQIAYHGGQAVRLRALHHRLHRFVVTLFVVALVAHGVHMAEEWLLRQRTPLMRYFWVLAPLAALLPAVGGATHGFLSQADFQSLARRSEGVRVGLQRLVDRLEGLDTPTGRSLRRVAAAATDVMGSELIDWRVEVGEKPLTLPHTH